jgi:GntR family transcriptional regulator
MAVRHREIADVLRDQIAQSVYPTGSSLPPESEIAARYGVSRGTVRQAVATLHAEGLVGSRQGARRLVLRQEATQSFAELRSFAQWARRNGHIPGGQVIRTRRRPCSADEAAALQVEPGDVVLHVLRLRTLDDEPVMLERTVYASWIADAVAALATDCPSVTERLRADAGITFAQGEHLIDAVAAGTVEASLLGVRRASPVLRHRHITTTPKGQPIEASDDRYRPGITAFGVHNSVDANALNRTVSA